MLGMFLVTTGGGIGLLSFGPISERLGRRGAFFLFHVGALAAALLLFNAVEGVAALIVALPVFGFVTLGMHAGYAIYFPELYPTRLRSTGTGLCFNAGRVFAAPTLLVVGWLRDVHELTLAQATSLMSLLFAVGAFAVLFAPETRGLELPE
jgi:MFS family permease